MKGAKWKEDGQQEEAVETGLRISTLSWISLPPSGLSGRTTRKGRCSRRSARRLTRHIITPFAARPSAPPIVFRAAHRSPSCSSPRLVLVLHLLLLLLLSSRSLHPSIFSGSNPPRFDSRGAATPPSPLLRLTVGAIWPL